MYKYFKIIYKTGIDDYCKYLVFDFGLDLMEIYIHFYSH
jgi:hypothetical protein